MTRESARWLSPFEGRKSGHLRVTRLEAQPTPSRDRQGQVASCGTFADQCCFQGIYFISNISFVSPTEMSAEASMETGWITHAVKNAWAKPALCGVCAEFDGL